MCDQPYTVPPTRGFGLSQPLRGIVYRNIFQLSIPIGKFLNIFLGGIMYERILREMEIKGIRYMSDLEKMAGLSNGSIKAIKNGHMPSSDRLARIANVLGVSAHYLLTGQPDDDPFDNPTPPEVYQKQRQVLALLEGLSEDSYKAAIDYLTYLKAREDLK